MRHSYLDDIAIKLVSFAYIICLVVSLRALTSRRFQVNVWDRNGDGAVTITDVIKVLGEVWLSATMIPFWLLEEAIQNYIPEVGRFFEIEKLIPSMGYWSVILGLAAWFAIAIAAVSLEEAVRRWLNRSTNN